MEYGKCYLNLVQDNYSTVWWKLFNCVDAKRCCNVLGIIELLFCLPLSNGHLERIFSQLKLIKNDGRTNLSENWLDQLVRINVDGPPMEKWDPSSALEIWYKEKCRRVTASTRASTSHVTESEEMEDDQSEPFFLGEWKKWVQISIGEQNLDEGDSNSDEDDVDFDVANPEDTED